VIALALRVRDPAGCSGLFAIRGRWGQTEDNPLIALAIVVDLLRTSRTKDFRTGGSMAKFKINDGNSKNSFTIDAEHFQMKGNFIDFSDADGHTVFWIAQSLVDTIERVRAPSAGSRGSY
jgi:hypothetical protein